MLKGLRLLVVCCLFAITASAQNTDIEPVSGLPFNFGNPGARSLGMGSAFIGLADDASAAQTNPAGLTILRKPEFSIELRHYTQDQVLATSGVFPDIERTSFRSFSRTAEVNFASIVVPLPANFVLGAYYHEPLRTRGSGEVLPQFNSISGETESDLPRFYLPTAGGAPVDFDECVAIINQTGDDNACLQYDIPPFVTSVDIRQRTFGLAGAWKIGTLSLGAAARLDLFREEAFSLFLNDETFDFNTFTVQHTGKPDELNTDFEARDQTDVTFNVGVKWAPSTFFSVGAVYRQGPEFDAPTYFLNESTGFTLVKTSDAQFHIPDVYGVGVSVRPLASLTLNADAVRVTYSNLVDDFQPLIDVDPSGYQADDITEIHAGAEYFLPTRIPFAIRAGWWSEPSHSIEWRGPVNTPNEIFASIYFPQREDQNHWSIGAGIALPRFSIDAAYDSSQSTKIGSISLVTRF